VAHVPGEPEDVGAVLERHLRERVPERMEDALLPGRTFALDGLSPLSPRNVET
jgi:hypothetical protein